VNPLFASVAPSKVEDVEVSVFAGHKGYVNSLAYHPEGMALDRGLMQGTLLVEDRIS
jgi:hypothetical protein